MMQPAYTVWKMLGETPLAALERLRTQEGIPADVPMTYAGRLDPAAEGLLIILTGEECKKKDEYSGRDKTYLAEILIGVRTDSFDMLGMPALGPVAGVQPSRAEIDAFLASWLGTRLQQYPPYSSKTVDGKQLHEYARTGEAVELPAHDVTLHAYEDLALEEVSRDDVLMRAGEVVAAVSGEFRTAEIAAAWAELDLPEKLPLLSVTLRTGSGFYVRQLAEDLGRALGTGACLYSLVRTEIGVR